MLMLAMVPLISNIGGAAIPDAAGDIHACYGDDGQLRVIDTEDGFTGSCKALETPLSWNQTGTPVGSLLGFNAAAGPDYRTTTSTTFIGLTGGSTTVAVPTGQTATIVAVFTAESSCYGADGYCSVQILINGVPGEPDVADNFAFDSTDDNTASDESWESHSVARFATGLGAGTHTVDVEWAVVDLGGAPTFSLDNFTLVVQAIKA
jgi:hypothetical protein